MSSTNRVDRAPDLGEESRREISEVFESLGLDGGFSGHATLDSWTHSQNVPAFDVVISSTSSPRHD
jgi:hypothetical protein